MKYIGSDHSKAKEHALTNLAQEVGQAVGASLSKDDLTRSADKNGRIESIRTWRHVGDDIADMYDGQGLEAAVTAFEAKHGLKVDPAALAGAIERWPLYGWPKVDCSTVLPEPVDISNIDQSASSIVAGWNRRAAYEKNKYKGGGPHSSRSINDWDDSL